MAAFPQNHRRNNGQRCENESYCNDYHQSSEKKNRHTLTHSHKIEKKKKMPEPEIESVTSCSRVLYATG